MAAALFMLKKRGSDRRLVISQYFSSVIRAEGEALSALSIDPVQVERAVNLLLNTDYPIILTGVGKSGLVARKIAATMSSLDTPSIFLDPTSAAHGDLGLVRAGAVVVALSNGGGSQELVSLLPALKARDARIIAVIGNADSPLGRSAAAVLCYGKVGEADNLGLAPTTSTTLQIAIGDALAVATSASRGVTAEGFSENHPAGLLGRRLAKVAHVMRKGDDLPTISLDSDFAEVVDVITAKRIGLACVVDSEGRLLGIVSDGDIRNALRRSEDPRATKARGLMQRSPETVAPGMRVGDVLEGDRGLARHLSLPVVSDGNRLEGVLVAIDLLG
ncbi:SIS domain-containing protein [Brevundimonas sp.]|uniref:KpsF/GutQ family sugar-phosphate isomerase n=1 Tax=Brevundimonas sp. TaxID=1871086 RepID=UPI00391BB643